MCTCRLKVNMLSGNLSKSLRISSRHSGTSSSSFARYLTQQDFSSKRETRPIKKLLIANRGEIAIRIARACKELGIKSMAVYPKEDAGSLHRVSTDESYLLGSKTPGVAPVAAYLNMDEIVSIAKEHGADAIHPGYGFLSENSEFARKVEAAGIQFVGPSSDIVHKMGDKVEARKIAIEAGVPVIPGTETPITNADDAMKVAKEIGYPVMFKAAYGGGGRGMRRVMNESEAKEAFDRASSEAKSAFGNGSMFVEKLVENGHHIEVQIMGDHHGNVVHLYERDCTVQRRHQKVVEIAPSFILSDAQRKAILDDAVKLARHVGYQNAGTVEFLVDGASGEHYFIEVNARLQVEHTVTEEVTGKDLVKTQLKVRQGADLPGLGLTQDKIGVNGCAIQLRVTTEDSQQNFMPSTGRIDFYQPPGGLGVRLDGAVASTGAVVTPHFDSLLVKLITKGQDFEDANVRAIRALSEMKIRGVTTNIPFILNVLKHPKFQSGDITTRFIDDHPELRIYDELEFSSHSILKYLAEVAVNGPLTPLVNADAKPDRKEAVIPPVPGLGSVSPVRTSASGSWAGPPSEALTGIDKPSVAPPRGWKQTLDELGPKGFAQAVRAHPGALLTDTTWRDAHQSLLATRVRTHDIMKVAPATAHLFPQLFSLENWGGATFDVAYRFLHENPWRRLERMREAVPNVPFQMLLRGANAVGYTCYADNAVHKFCDQAVRHGMDVFRVFDSLNYVENMKLGMDAVGTAGGVIEAAISYTGNVADPSRGPYTLEYYLKLARELVENGAHILCVKDMAGLLNPKASQLLIGSLRREFPDIPIHVHTHDTAGLGVASMVAAAQAGADVVDCAIDSMSGLTAQPSMGAIVSSLQHTNLDTGVDLNNVSSTSDYWEQVRRYYAAFECTTTLRGASSDVVKHEIPGGQYTNLHMQAFSLGMADKWPEIKKTYADANQLMGDIIKVTPSSKTVGDMAQFMVQNGITKDNILEKADEVSFPQSVVEYFQGQLGQPPFGFPEPLRSKVLKGTKPVEGRPGADIPPIDWEARRSSLREKFGRDFTDAELVSHVMYPKVFEDYVEFRKLYGDVSSLPSAVFFSGCEPGEELDLQLAGRNVHVKYVSKSPLLPDGSRDVFFEVMGMPRSINVKDRAAERAADNSASSKSSSSNAAKAVSGDLKQLGAPMQGTIVAVKVQEGQSVKKGEPVLVISAMKMEVVVVAPFDGVVDKLPVAEGADVEGGDLVVKFK